MLLVNFVFIYLCMQCKTLAMVWNTFQDIDIFYHKTILKNLDVFQMALASIYP